MIILSHDLFIIPFTLQFLCYEMELGMETLAEDVLRIDTAPAAVTHFSDSHPRIHIFLWTVTYIFSLFHSLVYSMQRIRVSVAVGWGWENPYVKEGRLSYALGAHLSCFTAPKEPVYNLVISEYFTIPLGFQALVTWR